MATAKIIILSILNVLVPFSSKINISLSTNQLKDIYKIEVEEIQERIRDTSIWLLSGMEQLMTLRAFFYHLKEKCKGETNEISKCDKALKSSSKYIFGIIGNLKYRSKLGEMIRGIRRMFPHAERYPGEGTIKKLEEKGILTIKDLIGKSVDDLVNMGIHKNYADLIIGYIRRRMA